MKHLKRLSYLIIGTLVLSQLPISSNATEILPSKYDLREENRVTKVEAQGQLGSCWALSTTAALESSLLTTEGITYDLSENNMVTQLSDAYEESFKRKADWGGDDNMAVGYYASWRGPVLEENDPYAFGGREENIVVRAGCETIKHVQDVTFLPKRKSALDNDLIKEMLMEFGGISMTMWKGTPSTFGEFYSNDNFAWYYPHDYMNKEGGGHSVTIVGWDDDFSKENFSVKPPGDGAFIAKNTKGEKWGNPDRKKDMGGYFYISYYDGMLGDPLDGYIGSSVYTRIDGVDNYDHIYQHDLLGYTEPLKSQKKEVWMGNAFVLDKGNNESIEAVSFYTLDEDLKYEIFVQRDFKGSVTKSKLRKLESGKFALPGYHTVDLQKSVQSKNGEKIFIAVKLVSTKGNPMIAIESSRGDVDSNATSKRGQSYVNVNGSWSDLLNKKNDGNVCLKIFTDDHEKNLVSVANMSKDVEFFVKWTKEHQPDAKANGYTEHQLEVIEEVRKAIKEPMSESEFMIHIKRLFAMMRDGHTHIWVPMEGPYLNLSFKWLGEGIITSYDGNVFKKRDKILSIGGKNPQELLVLLRDVVSSENDYWIEENAITYLNQRLFLEHLGLLNDDDTVDVQILRSGKNLRYRVPLENKSNFVGRRKNKKWYDTSVNTTDNYGYIRYDESVRYNEDGFKELCKDIDDTFLSMKKDDINNLVIDYRNNPGGYLSVLNVINSYLDKGTLYGSGNREYKINIDNYQIEQSDVKFDGNIYILTSNYTYSAAVYATRILRDNNIALIVGEPTGENPAFNTHGNGSDGELPFLQKGFMMTSQHTFRINGYDNAELSFYPDIPIFETSEELFSNQDNQLNTLKKVIKGNIIYADKHIDIKPSTKYSFFIKKGKILECKDKTIQVPLKGQLDSKQLKVIKLLTGEEVECKTLKNKDSISLNFKTSPLAKDAYLISILDQGKEYRFILRYPEFNIENGFIEQKEVKIQQTYNNNGHYKVLNIKPDAYGSDTKPLEIVKNMRYRKWGYFDLVFNKGIKVLEEPLITISKGDSTINISIVETGAIGSRYLMITPAEDLEPGTYKVHIPSGSFESYYGETLEDIDVEITIP